MGDGILVLHVDDEEAIADLASDYLERANDRIEAVTAASGQEGLAVLSAEPVDCVVSDYHMPDMDGLEFLEAVRERRPDLPFILFTGEGSEAIASEAISAGVTDYLQKETGPDQYTVLANRIENAVEAARAERAAGRERARRSALFENAPDPIVEAELDGEAPVVVAVNGAFAATFGHDAGAVEGRPADEVLVDGGRDLEGSLRRCIRDDERGRAEIRRDTAEGMRDFSLRLIPVDDAEAAYAWYVDVTEYGTVAGVLRGLADALEAYGDAGSREAVARAAADAARQQFGYAAVRVLLLEGDRLGPVAVSAGDPETPAYRVGEGVVGSVYEAGEPAVVGDTGEADLPLDSCRSALLLPMEGQGLVAVGASATDAFDDPDVAFGRLFAATVGLALRHAGAG